MSMTLIEKYLEDRTRRLIVYISGPYRNKEEDSIHKNIEVSREAARRILNIGMFYISPHMNTAFMGGVVEDVDAFLVGDLELVKRSDAMIMLKGWKHSEGARAERNFALKMNVPVFTTLYSLDLWRLSKNL